MTTLFADTALTVNGWQNNVQVSIDNDGLIRSVDPDCLLTVGAQHVGALVPAPVNLHSHAFQHAMAGMAEHLGAHATDNFWTWRTVMYQFLDQLSPDDVQAITAQVQMLMLEAGYAAVGEFHYLHHQSNGSQYSDLAEMSTRIIAAADDTGIGLTLLPVFYEHGGCDGRALASGQRRFGCSLDMYQSIYNRAESMLKELPADSSIGRAPHSLRAVSQQSLNVIESMAAGAPIHLHIAEQAKEVEEVVAAWGQRPVHWLLQNHDIDKTWCLIHCTHMQTDETIALAQSGAIVGLCPITESNLGDGIFNAKEFQDAGGSYGIGSDSNIRISLSEELRTLEYSQRLRHRARAVLATTNVSTGRMLFNNMLRGGAQAAQRYSGCIDKGYQADLIALNNNLSPLVGRAGDSLLDSFIFAGDDSLIQDVWSAGRHLVHEGRHVRRDVISARYHKTLLALQERI